jgi:hypothetical protein
MSSLHLPQDTNYNIQQAFKPNPTHVNNLINHRPMYLKCFNVDVIMWMCYIFKILINHKHKVLKYVVKLYEGTSNVYFETKNALAHDLLVFNKSTLHYL